MSYIHTSPSSDDWVRKTIFDYTIRLLRSGGLVCRGYTWSSRTLRYKSFRSVSSELRRELWVCSYLKLISSFSRSLRFTSV